MMFSMWIGPQLWSLTESRLIWSCRFPWASTIVMHSLDLCALYSLSPLSSASLVSIHHNQILLVQSETDDQDVTYGSVCVCVCFTADTIFTGTSSTDHIQTHTHTHTHTHTLSADIFCNHYRGNIRRTITAVWSSTSRAAERKAQDNLKGIVHPKMKIVSSFTHPQVVPNLYECVCSAEHKGRYSEECGKQSSSGS